MAFHHLPGITTLGAADEIVDWFARFQAWIVGTVGWTIFSGAGTTDLRIWSAGEAGGLTRLFVHVWRPGGVGNLVRMEVSDDGVPTHETNEAGTLDSGGVQFPFWMSADLDAIVIVWKVGAGYRKLYAGLVMPFAATVVNETYCMIATSNITAASILRRFDNVWDQDDFLYEHQNIRTALLDRVDGSLALGGCYFGDHADIAGQLKHIGCRFLGDPALNPEDTIQTGPAGAETDWIMLRESTNTRFAMRTGGVLPIGTPDGAHFAHATGVAVSVANFFALLVAHLTAVGWTATDYSGVSGFIHDWFFHSTGEDGTEDIYFRVTYKTVLLDRIYYLISDGIPGAHATPNTITAHEQGAHFPTQYYFSSDLDCHCHTINGGGNYHPIWAGKMKCFAPGLPSTPYKVGLVVTVAFNQWMSYIMRDHGGNWAAGGLAWGVVSNAEGVNADNSNPNNYDGVTYMVWPHVMRQMNPGGAVGAEMLGQLTYFFRTDGGGIATLDTITIAAQVYTVFFCNPAGGIPWAMRTT